MQKTSSSSQPHVGWPAPITWEPGLILDLEQRILPRYLPQCRWFGGKSLSLQATQIIQDTVFPGTDVHVLLVKTTFSDGSPEHYLLPLCLLQGSQAAAFMAAFPNKVLGHWEDAQMLCDALQTSEFQRALFMALSGRAPSDSSFGLILESPPQHDEKELDQAASQARILSGEQSNTSISYADRWLVKFFRKFEVGIHPEVEMTQHLTRHHFQVPPFLSALNIPLDAGTGVAAMLTHYTPHQNDGWTFTLEALRHLFAQVIESPPSHHTDRQDEILDGSYPARAAQLGRLTARMHIALAATSDDPNFHSQPFTPQDSRSLCETMRANATRVLAELQCQLTRLPEPSQTMAREVLETRHVLLEAFGKLSQKIIECSLIRVHGDFHLGQTLNTGTDFVIIDFEGEPRLPLGQRRLPRPALRDVAGMVRSFEYAASAALDQAREEEKDSLIPWAQAWADTVIKNYLCAYFETAQNQKFLPESPTDARLLLDLHILDKALYEIGYELSYRPHLVSIPLRAVSRLRSNLAS
ncbi:MAG: putative maltokinase [Verrucomicrobiota bacterium]